MKNNNFNTSIVIFLLLSVYSSLTSQTMFDCNGINFVETKLYVDDVIQEFGSNGIFEFPDGQYREFVNQAEMRAFCKRNNISLDTIGYIRIPLPKYTDIRDSVISNYDIGLSIMYGLSSEVRFRLEDSLEYLLIVNVRDKQKGIGWIGLESDTTPIQKQLEYVRQENLEVGNIPIRLNTHVGSDRCQEVDNPKNYDIWVRADSSFIWKKYFWVDSYNQLNSCSIGCSLKHAGTKEPIKWGTPEFHRIMDCIVDKMVFVCGKE